MDLPIELIHKIFNYLNLIDLFKCKLVCKSWHSIILKFKLKSLVLLRHYIRKSKLSWYHTGSNIDSKYDSIDPKLFLCLINEPILNQLKYLKIDATYLTNKLNLNELNKFTHLKHLEIEHHLEFEQNFNLTLNELEILNLNFPNTESRILIDAPKLKAVQFDCDYDGFSGFSFKHPESITHLETIHFGKYLKQFKNVTYLKSHWLNVLDETILVHLTKLEEIHFEKIIHDFSIFNDLSKEPDFLYVCDHDINPKTKVLWQKKPNLKIYFFGILLTNGNEIKKDWINEKELIYAKNYDRLKFGLEFVHNLNYHKLMTHFNNKIPSDFFLKFNNIQNCSFINIDQSKPDEEHFYWFLKNLDNLNSLTLKYAKLSQNFYNRIHTIDLSYRLLIEESSDFILNYDFILNLKQITSFITNQEIDKRLLELLLSNLDDENYLFEYISFKFYNESYCIKRIYENSNYKYTLLSNILLIEDEVNLNSIIEYFQNN